MAFTNGRCSSEKGSLPFFCFFDPAGAGKILFLTAYKINNARLVVILAIA
ncbi:MAG: hypothetical protein JWP79_164 [Polaromonas sp.]|jgi:hypothetical protein|nr:hypothetical protein [Polaromonas sp.]